MDGTIVNQNYQGEIADTTTNSLVENQIDKDGKEDILEIISDQAGKSEQEIDNNR